ncbi:MAG: glutamine-synthetase adenylyltransferase [Paracoccaceae bacterium]
MTLAARMTRCPLPHDGSRTAEIAARFAAEPAETRALLAGAAGSSPYLAHLIQREADWLDPVMTGTPEAALSDLMAATAAEADAPDLAVSLRRAKRRLALLVALADLSGVWPLETVTGALTAFADLATVSALARTTADERRRGRLPDNPTGAIFALAMGKTGACELNYSSDIDLIFLFDDTAFAPSDLPTARTGFVRAVRRLTAILSDITADGYVFRTDLRLRPDAAVTPVCMSAGAAEQYYEAEGRTWERAAYIKARASAGDIAAGERFLAALTPFVWRRHLDFAAIRDAYDMRLRIRGHKGLHRAGLDGLDLKLGAGGIREIEFFTQTRQLIAGGRDPELRARGTVAALAALARKGWVPPEAAAEMTAAYRAHRETEHRLQMIADAQTHALPAEPAGWDRLARLSGEADTARFRDTLARRIATVSRIAEDFFAPGRRARPGPPRLAPEIRALTDRWKSYPAFRSDRAQATFARIEPALIDRFDRAANPAEALTRFDRFLAGLPAGVQLFSLFEANPPLVDLIVDICSTSPALSEYLGRNSQVLDAVLGGDFFTAWPGAQALAASLGDRLADVPDYEARLARARVWAREWHFRTGVHHLRGLTGSEAAGREYADLAGACLAGLWPAVAGEFARKHGPPPGQGACVVAMGSLGAGRLHAQSDLDLIVIYDADGNALSDGRRPLPARAYFARLTQALVTALTAPMADGRLYAVDMRLRPSGRQGPVATSLEGFRAYQIGEAWTWEHLALTRARPVAGDPALAARIEETRRDVLTVCATRPAIAPDTAEMRQRIFAAKAPDGAWDVKTGPGRLQDIELFAQSLALRAASPARQTARQLADAAAAGLVLRADADRLASAHRLYWRLQCGTRLLTAQALDIATIGEGGRAFLLREAEAAETGELAARIASLADESAALIGRYLSPGLDAAPPAGS